MFPMALGRHIACCQCLRCRYHQGWINARRLRVSFLDRLKREADQQRLQAEQAAAERDQRESRYRTQIEPKMKALTAYLEGLASTLREVKPPIVIRMAIQGYGELCLVPYWDYKVEHERRHRSFAATMTWSLKVDGERTPVVRADGVTRVKTLTSIFRQYHLGGIKEEKRTPQGELSCATFHARGFVKARMEATVSAEDPILRLMFENASWLGASRRQVPVEQLDDDLFDQIARFVVREDDSLFTEELPDALRQRLRRDPAPAAASAATEVQPPAGAFSERETAPAPRSPASAPVPTPQPSMDAWATAVTPPAPTPAPTPVPAPAPFEPVFQIDESKLGLANFEASEQSPSVFSSDALQRARPAPQLDQPSTLSGSIGVIPAPPPVSGGEVIEIDESKLGLSGETAPIVIERISVPGSAPAPTPRTVPSDTLSAVPAVATTAPVAPRPAAPAAATTASPPSPAATAPAPANSAGPTAVSIATATAGPADLPTGASDESDDSKERDAALFRLRMRAMLARLRSDESDEGKG